MGPNNRVLDCRPDPRGNGQSGGTSQPTVMYRNYPACGRLSRPYPVDSSSDAACRCQYCSHLLIVPTGLRVNGKMSTEVMKSRWNQVIYFSVRSIFHSQFFLFTAELQWLYKLIYCQLMAGLALAVPRWAQGGGGWGVYSPSPKSRLGPQISRPPNCG